MKLLKNHFGVVLSLSVINALHCAQPLTYEQMPADIRYRFLTDIVDSCNTLPCLQKSIGPFAAAYTGNSELVNSQEGRLLIKKKKQQIIRHIQQVLTVEPPFIYSSIQSLNQFTQDSPPGGGFQDYLNYSKLYNALAGAFDAIVHEDRATEDMFKILIENGVDPNHRNREGETFLMRMRNVQNVGYLIKYGAKVNAKDYRGKTALIHLAKPSMYQKQGQLACAQLLIQHGALINLGDNNGRTALMHAIIDDTFPFEDMVKLLVAQHANIYEKDNWGKTALGLARISSKEMEDTLKVRTTDYYLSEAKRRVDQIILFLEQTQAEQPPAPKRTKKGPKP